MTKLTPEMEQNILKDYQGSKANLTRVARKYHIAEKRVKKIVLKLGGKIKATGGTKQYFFNENYFDQIDSEEKAYFLGFLYADGCNHKTGYSADICLQEEDKYILERFSLAIESKRPLYFLEYSNKNPKLKNQYKLHFQSQHMCAKLAELGCWSRKSLTLKFPTEKQVPKEFLKHFIRGVFDGDGHVGSYFHRKWLKSKFLQISIVSTEDFCLALQKYLLSEGMKTNILILTNKITTRLRAKAEDALNFLNWLYQDSTIFLERKFQKYQEFLEWKASYLPKNRKQFTEEEARQRRNESRRNKRKLKSIVAVAG